jgi:hypothetical protein
MSSIVLGSVAGAWLDDDALKQRRFAPRIVDWACMLRRGAPRKIGARLMAALGALQLRERGREGERRKERS